MSNISSKVYTGPDGVEHKTPTESTTAVVIKFGNGEKVEIVLASLPEGIRNIAQAHGIAQKVGDAYAGAKGDIDLAYGLASAMASRLMQNEWNLRAEGGQAATMLAQAIAEATDEELGTVLDMLAEKSKEEKDDLRKHPQVALILARMTAEKAQAKADALAAAAADAQPINL